MGCIGDALVRILKKQFPDYFPGRPMSVVEGIFLVCIGLLILAWFIYYLCTHKRTNEQAKADREWSRVRLAPFLFIYSLIRMLLKKIAQVFNRKK